MTESGANTRHSEARAMIDTFASVGATHFDVTWTNTAGDEQAFRRNCIVPYVHRLMPVWLDDADQRQRNVIVRPRGGSGVTFVQLDDLDAGWLERVASLTFLILETSPGNFQAWVAVAGIEDKDVVRRFKKGAGADATASGATRIAGSRNFKGKYAPDFPRVTIRTAQPGRTTSADELDRLGLVAPAPCPTPRPCFTRRRQPPVAELCAVRGCAPLNSEETGPDICRADFVWCMTAITWGWTAEEAADRLMEESDKARKNGKGYADLTTRNAALAVERRRQQPKRPRIG